MDKYNKEKFYNISVICKNCRFGFKEPGVFLTIPKGITIKEYIKNAKCRRCDCIGHFKHIKHLSD